MKKVNLSRPVTAKRNSRGVKSTRHEHAASFGIKVGVSMLRQNGRPVSAFVSKARKKQVQLQSSIDTGDELYEESYSRRSIDQKPTLHHQKPFINNQRLMFKQPVAAPHNP